jgi:hypothetical protein
MESGNKVRNPLTGRMITVGGDVYCKLLKSGQIKPSKNDPIEDIQAALECLNVKEPGDEEYMPPPPPAGKPLPLPGYVAVKPRPAPALPLPAPPAPASRPSYAPPAPAAPKAPILAPVRREAIPSPEGVVPRDNGFQQQIAAIQAEEDARRNKTCGICKSYAVDRYQPFTLREVNNLGVITQACQECSDLCIQRATRAGRPNAPECNQYRAAVVSGQRQYNALMAQQRMNGIRLNEVAGRDVGQFFPQVPKGPL